MTGQHEIGVYGVYQPKKEWALVLSDADGRAALFVDYDGTVVFGEGVTQDVAARLFWDFIGQFRREHPIP